MQSKVGDYLPPKGGVDMKGVIVPVPISGW